MCGQENIETFVATEKEKDAILDLIGISYIPREPMSLGLHCTLEDLLPFFSDVVKDCVQSHASIAMRDKSTGNIIAIMLNIVIKSPDENIFDEVTYASEKSNIYKKIIRDFCSGINVLKEEGVKGQLELLMLTVHPDYSKRGLAKELIRVSEEKGREMGCNIATIQATNFVTDIIANKLEYKTIHKLDLSTVKGENGQQLLDLAAMNGTTHFTYLSKRL